MNILLILTIIALIGSVGYLSPLVWRLKRMRTVRKEISGSRILALTYDDGPSETLTPQLLDLLRKHNAKATFFMLGRNAKLFPEIVNRVAEEGHSIGCHSDQHLHAWKSLPWRTVSDIDAGFDSLSPWVRPNGLFRPPYGKMTLLTLWSVLGRGSPIWWWTIDSRDTFETLPKPSEITKQVLQQKGAIVLMHDMERSHARKDFVLEATAALLDLARHENMSVIPLGELSQ